MDSYRCDTQFLQLYRLHRKLLSASLRKESITPGQPPLLEILFRNEGITQSELSHRCHLEPATITNTLALMERDGLIDRRTDMGDRRIRRIYLTNKGYAKCLLLNKIIKNNSAVCFDNLTEEEREYFFNISQKIINNINKALTPPVEDNSKESAIMVE